MREGSLEAPTRHPLDWRSESFYNEEDLNKELERVFDICHGCRRCVTDQRITHATSDFHVAICVSRSDSNRRKSIGWPKVSH